MSADRCETLLLTPQDAPQAAELLRRGAMVGLPTETVYGLGADGLNAEAVGAIFTAKGRPQDNPLILHLPSEDWLADYCRDIPPVAYDLTRRFWPGPLTLILRRASVVPGRVTAGLDTVGVRCPDCAVTREVIALAGVPIAAPSGNTSGRPSPTTAQAMWEDMAGKIPAILDGGPCLVGVESTILDLTAPVPRLLRPGGLPMEALEAALGPIAVDPAVVRPMGEGEKPRAPGMKYRHYAPRASVTVLQGPPEVTAAYLRDHLPPGAGVIAFSPYVSSFLGHRVEDLGPPGDAPEQARRLFAALRAFDETDVTAIFAQSPPPEGLGLAVSNRLHKAAGFHIIHLEG